MRAQPTVGDATSLPGLVVRKQSEQAYKKCSSVIFASEAPDSRFLPWLPSLKDELLLLSYVYFMCEHSACALAQQKTALHAITHGCEPLCGYWELNWVSGRAARTLNHWAIFPAPSMMNSKCKLNKYILSSLVASGHCFYHSKRSQMKTHNFMNFMENAHEQE